MAGFVVRVAFVDMLLAVFDEPVIQTCRLASHRGDRFGGSQAGAQPPVSRSQIALAPQQRGGCLPKCPGSPIHYLARPPVEDLPPLRSLMGHNPSRLVKCFSPANSWRSAPASAITVCAVSTSIPFTGAPSMPRDAI